MYLPPLYAKKRPINPHKIQGWVGEISCQGGGHKIQQNILTLPPLISSPCKHF